MVDTVNITALSKIGLKRALCCISTCFARCPHLSGIQVHYIPDDLARGVGVKETPTPRQNGKIVFGQEWVNISARQRQAHTLKDTTAQERTADLHTEGLRRESVRWTMKLAHFRRASVHRARLYALGKSAERDECYFLA
jgi:hypothetical protein